MQFLTNLISKIGLFVFFLLLEIVAVYFMATKSDFHKNAIGVKAMAVNAYISDKTSFVTNFINLPKTNKELIEENALLRNKLARQPRFEYRQDSSMLKIDSIYHQKYTYLTAEVVDYSLRKKDNYFLINKGTKEGIKENMAVLSPKGVVGAILYSSDHHSSVLSVLHSRTNIKAKVKGIDRLGIIIWPGEDHRELALTEIPKYLKVEVGDTVMTAGASSIYPEGELIGRVKTLKANDDTGDYEILVETFDDLAKVRNVYVVENLDKLDIDKAKSREHAITE